MVDNGGNECTGSSLQRDKGSLNDQISEHIKQSVQYFGDSDEATIEDILRMYFDQISMMLITEQVRSAFALDPFQHLKEHIPNGTMTKIMDSLDVVSHDSVRTLDGYVRNEAIVRFSVKKYDVVANKKRPRMKEINSSCDTMELQFRYLRTSMLVDTSTISYNIDLLTTTNNIKAAPMPLLWININAASNVPSNGKAINMCDTENNDDQWSDVNDDDSNNSTNPDVTVKTSTAEKGDMDSIYSNVDRYEAGMDPDVAAHLEQFLQQPNYQLSMDVTTAYNDITLFFFLMTFPFYEHEWDVVGFLLTAVFDSDVE
jgi:hypothetical protein